MWVKTRVVRNELPTVRIESDRNRLLLEMEPLSAIPLPTLSAILSAVAAAKAEAVATAEARRATTDETGKCHNYRTNVHFGQVFKVISTMRSSSARVAPVDA
jgi:hypothetical protein